MLLGGYSPSVLARGTSTVPTPSGLSNGISGRCGNEERTLSQKFPQTNIMRDIVADCSSKAGDESTQNSSRSVMQPPGDNYAGASSRASENVALLPGEAEVEGAVEQDIPQQSLEVMHSMGLEIGSMVEIPLIDGQRERYGVIRWIGHLTAVKGKLVAGLELVCIALLAGVHLEEHYKKIISLRIFMT